MPGAFAKLREAGEETETENEAEDAECEAE